MRARVQQVAFKLGDRGRHAHGHLAGRTRQIDSAERQAANADTLGGKPLNGRSHIHDIASKPVQLRRDQYIVGFEPVEQPG